MTNGEEEEVGIDAPLEDWEAELLARVLRSANFMQVSFIDMAFRALNECKVYNHCGQVPELIKAMRRMVEKA